MNQRNVVLSSLVAMALAVPAVSLAAVSRIDVLTSEQAIELEMGGRACGTPDATVDEMSAVRDQIRAYRKSLGVVGPIEVTIPIAFHVLTNGDEGNVPDSQLEEQVRVMNQRYAGSGYHFRLG